MNPLVNTNIRKIYYVKAYKECQPLKIINGENFVKADLLLLVANLAIIGFLDQLSC